MPTTPSSTNSPVTDEQLVVDLSNVLDAAKAELAELEPKREQLTARIASLEHTIAVYKGETPPAKRRASKRRPKAKPAASETPAS